ncbi:MAG: tRNA (mo5U34)-methyltransferase [Solirubrobacteraceae bacterium]|nr:tRNA (mo5U34)-methyltransferase [Solirubrobacteraceae bacterium]
MPFLARAWLAAARARRRASRRRHGPPPREALVARHASGRSFADVGCMWSVDGAIAFAAEAAGATSVTGLDVMGATPAFEAERARRGSSVRFVRGDLHDPAVVAQVGVHDVVWCSGLLYHAPHPLLTLERLRELTGETLLLATESLPEVPGLRGACVFYPGADRAPFAAPGRVGLATPFDAARGYENWWWGITPSALRGMLDAAGFAVVDLHDDGLHLTATARRK